MSQDSITEVTSQSWFSRIGSSIRGILTGFVLIGAAFCLLFWNEGRAVTRAKSLDEGAGIVVSASVEAVDPTNEGKLIHVTGPTKTNDVLEDQPFGVSASGIKLRRSVEMYQWKEKTSSNTEKKLGGGTETKTTYSYEKSWSSRLIDSTSFKTPAGHVNPGEMEFSSDTKSASNVTLGAYTLSSGLIGQISNFESLPVALATLPEELKNRTHLTADGFYIGTNPKSATIGDQKVSFEIVKPSTTSIVSKQISNSFEPYFAEAGSTVELLSIGTVSAENMFKAAHASNRLMTWVLRALGFFLMFFGFKLCLSPLAVLGDVVPLIGTIVGAGLGIVSFLVAAVLSLVTIAVAWFAYRPLLSAGLIVAAVACVFAVRKYTKKSPEPEAAQNSPA